ncbi:hypothetical protein PanWU01x14_333310 [Parasponia andersonii]|uniref:Uncharacterized protein n=1 Tax=Parasponia andersonii TaxID=3476 RepID=A0A2P5AH07_PARAD|nr:hypothetical protein PanWU01x14_333310 [Parasponia andersonii]
MQIWIIEDNGSALVLSSFKVVGCLMRFGFYFVNRRSRVSMTYK